MKISIHILQSDKQFDEVAQIQKRIWGPEDVVPSHILQAVVKNGGILLGATQEGNDTLVGFVFGFIGTKKMEGKVQVKHCSHILGVLPDFENQGIGYSLKRAQWQLVRQQGIEVITWTYDPLLSKNAYFNIDRLGAICNEYFEEYYGEMTDKQNQGLPSDRFQVELWVNSSRVTNRMSKRPRLSLDLGHYFAAGAEILNPTKVNENGWVVPPETPWDLQLLTHELTVESSPPEQKPPIYLVEIPSNFQELHRDDQGLGLVWRHHTRKIFQQLFQIGYMVTDFVHLKGTNPRSFYVLSDGERTLGE